MLKTKRRTTKMGGSMPRPTLEPDDATFIGRVALRLKHLRKAAKLDHAHAATAISKAGYDVTTSTIYRWEQGRTQPHVEAFPAIAKAYHLKSTRDVLPKE
jgi:DNA-binding XRE family transcriptional regulator